MTTRAKRISSNANKNSNLPTAPYIIAARQTTLIILENESPNKASACFSQ